MKKIIEVCKVQSYGAINKLKLHPNNPRTISRERLNELKCSIRDKGFYQPILVLKKGGYVLAGNHRLIAARELIDDGYIFESPDGKENVLPIVVEDVDEETATAILYETNNHYATWVEDKLKEALDEAHEKGFDVVSFGFDQDFLDGLLTKAEADADDILKGADKDRTIEPVDGTKLRDALGEETYESLIMPTPLYEDFTGMLMQLSRAMSPDWKPGDAYTEALQAVIQALRESGAVDDIISRMEVRI